MLFVLIALRDITWSAMVVFIVAAATDWLDGYWARKYGQVTTLGRILDPFVDKIIICGTFIYLAAVSRAQAWLAGLDGGGGRRAGELLVTALRASGTEGGRFFGHHVGQAENGVANAWPSA